MSSDCNNKNKFIACNSSNCMKCKDKKLSDMTFLGDSGTSQTFTSEIIDFSTYEKSQTVLEYKQQTKIQSCVLLEKEQFSLLMKLILVMAK